MAVELAEVMPLAERAVQVLGRHLPLTAAFLFGSHVSQTADEDSDVDIAVFVEGGEDLDLMQRVRLDRRVHQEVSNAVEVHYFPARETTHSEPGSFATYVRTHGVMLPA